jgi:hypothetical protein
MTTENPTSFGKRPLEGGQPLDRSASPAAIRFGGERVSLAPESRPAASSINHVFSATTGCRRVAPLSHLIGQIGCESTRVSTRPLVAR